MLKLAKIDQVNKNFPSLSKIHNKGEIVLYLRGSPIKEEIFFYLLKSLIRV